LFIFFLKKQGHVGHTCTYQGGFLPNINHHRLQVAIDRYYTKLPVPECIPQTNCFGTFYFYSFIRFFFSKIIIIIDL